METPISWSTLRAYSTPIEANLARSLLEAEGIPCFIRDEHTIGINWLYSNVLGGVRLCVSEEDLVRAKEILAASLPEEEAAPLRCPECGSERVEDRQAQRGWSFLSAAIVGLPLPFAKKRFHCEQCGHSFRMRA